MMQRIESGKLTMNRNDSTLSFGMMFLFMFGLSRDRFYLALCSSTCILLGLFHLHPLYRILRVLDISLSIPCIIKICGHS